MNLRKEKKPPSCLKNIIYLMVRDGYCGYPHTQQENGSLSLKKFPKSLTPVKPIAPKVTPTMKRIPTIIRIADTVELAGEQEYKTRAKTDWGFYESGTKRLGYSILM